MPVKEEAKKYLTEEEGLMLYDELMKYVQKNRLSDDEKIELAMKHMPLSRTFAEHIRAIEGEESFKQTERENIEKIKRQEWIYGIQS